VWLAVPAVALLAGLVMLGTSQVAPHAPADAPIVLAQSDDAPANPAVTAAPAAPAAPSAPATSEFSAAQKKDIELIIKNYLVNNPEIFL
ncbi:hypothetical protein, partial [Vibrio vulnificus]|uniref:hypothetical protein n=1 Tax=Vibrio vulnificus TaxID=672 RepID=UPI0019D465E2